MRSHRPCALWLLGALVASSALLGGCGKKDKDDDDEEEEEAGVPSGPGSGTTGTLTVSTLSALPNLEEALKSKGAGLALAVSGVPPKFVEITADTIEQYLTGDVETVIAAITAARATNDWTTVKAQGDSFRDGQAKCGAMQDAGRQLSELTQRTKNGCYMGQVDKAEGSMLKKISGDDLTAGTFFSNGDADAVRSIEMFGGELDKIMFQIQAKGTEPGIYQVTMTYCKTDGTAQGADRIRVNNNDGTMTYEVAHSGAQTQEGVEHTFQSSGKVTGYLKASGSVATFDDAKPRTMAMSNKGTKGGYSNQFNGMMTIDSDVLTNKFIGMNTHAAGSGLQRGVSSVRFAGTKASNIVIYEGARTGKGAFTPTSGNATEHSKTVGFEYQEGQTPAYASVTTSTFIDTVAAVDFTTDAVLSQTAPADPDTSLLSSGACALTPTAIYRMAPTAEQQTTLKAACDSKWEKMDSVCNAIQAQEAAVWSALKANPTQTDASVK